MRRPLILALVAVLLTVGGCTTPSPNDIDTGRGDFLKQVRAGGVTEVELTNTEVIEYGYESCVAMNDHPGVESDADMAKAAKIVADRHAIRFDAAVVITVAAYEEFCYGV